MHSYRKPKLPIDMEYAMSSTGNGDGARNDESVMFTLVMVMVL